MKKVAYGMLLVMGIAAIIDAYILSFTTSVYNFGTWFPGIVGLLLIGFSIAKLTGKAEGLFAKHRRFINFLKLCLLIWCISFVGIEAYILFPDTKQQSAEPDYIVILGAGLNGDKLSWLLSERMVTALEYLKNNKTSMVVVSGGQGPDEAVAEGTAMKDYLVGQGVEASRIVVEDKSKSTLENFRFTRSILPGDKNKIVVVTSNFHMRRAILLAERTGFTADGLSSSTPPPIALNCYLREYFALIKSYAVDW